MKWFVKCIRNYVNFKGRARRAEYWYFTLFASIIILLAILLDWLVFSRPIGVFYSLAALFMILPSLAVWVRRLHDTGRSGKRILWYYLSTIVWMVLLVATGASFFFTAMQGNVMQGMPPVAFIVVYCVGLIGLMVWGILFLVWACAKGDVGENKYGPDPKEIEA